MLMAATVGSPVMAQTPAELYTALTAPATTVNVTVEQRAEAMPALALMPANCDYCLSITDIPGFINTLKQAGYIDEVTYTHVLPAKLKMVRSIAVGGADGSNAMVNALCGIYSLYSADSYLKAIDNLALFAAEQYEADLRAISGAARSNNLKEYEQALSSVKLAPIYGALVLNPGNESSVQDWYAELTALLQQKAASTDNMEFVSVNGFSGIKVTCTADEHCELYAEISLLEKELSKRTFYIMFRAEGDAIVAAVCEEPSQIAFAPTPQESILATDKLSTVDSKIGNGLFLATYVSAEIMQSYTTMSTGAINKAGNTLSSMFNALAAKGDANQAIFTKAAQGVDAITAAWLHLYAADCDQPLSASVSWSGNTIDIDVTADNFGYNFKPATLRLTDKAADPNTIYYSESAYFESNRWPNLGDMVEAGLSVAQGFLAAAPTEQQAQVAANMAAINSYIPEIKEGFNAFSTITSGLDNSMALIIDKKATMPTILGGTRGNTTAFPRVAFYSGVSNRAKLGEGWDALRKTAGNALSKAGLNPAYVNMLPIKSTKVGNGMNYSLVLPWFSKDLIPTLTVDDSSFVIGSSETLNAEIMQTATGSMQLPGMVGTINFKPLAEMMQSIADDMLARLPEPQPVDIRIDCSDAYGDAPIESETEDEDEMDIEEDSDVYIMEMDEEYDECYGEELSEEQVRAETFATIAAVTKGIAEVIDSIHLTCVTEKDTTRTRIQIKLNK